MIALRVPPRIKKILEKLAKAERRTLANFCYNSVVEYVKKTYDINIHEDKNEKE